MYVEAPFSKSSNFRNKTRRLAIEGLAAVFLIKGLQHTWWIYNKPYKNNSYTN
jgi:hypothetical protein